MIEAVRFGGRRRRLPPHAGNARDDADDPRYADVTGEIITWLDERAAELERLGLDREKIIVDPGIGFGKRLEDNLAILNEIGDFQGLRFPRDGRLLEEVVHRQDHGSRSAVRRVHGGFAALAKCRGGASLVPRSRRARNNRFPESLEEAIEGAGAPAMSTFSISTWRSTFSTFSSSPFSFTASSS